METLRSPRDRWQVRSSVSKRSRGQDKTPDKVADGVRKNLFGSVESDPDDDAVADHSSSSEYYSQSSSMDQSRTSKRLLFESPSQVHIH